MMTESNKDVTGVSTIAQNKDSSINVTPSMNPELSSLQSSYGPQAKFGLQLASSPAN